MGFEKTESFWEKRKTGRAGVRWGYSCEESAIAYLARRAYARRRRRARAYTRAEAYDCWYRGKEAVAFSNQDEDPNPAARRHLLRPYARSLTSPVRDSGRRVGTWQDGNGAERERTG